jgi:hypothetical protein
MNNPFNWREYVQPFVPVPLVADSGHIHQDRHIMVPSDKVPPTPQEIAEQRKRDRERVYKAELRAKANATRVNDYSDIGRATGLTNSERAAR